MTTINDYIPEDIIVDILSKLPSKSVLRFRIACKTWYSLISDPVFINLHSKRAPQSPKILFKSTSHSEFYQLLDYENSSFVDCCLSHRPIHFPGETSNFPKILGSSCGLVCVAIYYYGTSFTIWNPLTRECREIPNLSTMSSSEREKHYFHGFGYDSVSNDFKLVISRDRIIYNVFSLKENSWKIVTCPVTIFQQPLHAILCRNSLAIVLNGIFYWIVVPQNNVTEIIAFDVRNKTFQKLQLPQLDVPWNFYRDASLLEHRGRLCVSFMKYASWPAKEIWMMNEYGTGWVHLLTINNSPILNCFELPVLCISTTSEVEFHNDEKYFSRCGREEEEKLDEKFRKNPYLYGAVLYVETLISPGHCNAEDRWHRPTHKMEDADKIEEDTKKLKYQFKSLFCCYCK